VQARPAMAQGQLRDVHWLAEGQKQHGSGRAGFVLLFFWLAGAGLAAGGATDGSVEASLGDLRLFPTIGVAFLPAEKVNWAGEGPSTTSSSWSRSDEEDDLSVSKAASPDCAGDSV